MDLTRVAVSVASGRPLRVPHPHRAVHRARDRALAVAERHGPDRTLVAGSWRALARSSPDPHRAIKSPRPRACRRPRAPPHGPHPRARTAWRAPPALHVPDPQGVSERRDRALAVRRERDRIDHTLGAGQRGERLAALGVPDPHGAVPRAARDRALAVGEKRHRPDPILVAGQRGERLAALGVPDPHGAIRRARDRAPAVGRERYRQDPTLVAGQHGGAGPDLTGRWSRAASERAFPAAVARSPERLRAPRRPASVPGAKAA